VTSQQDAQHMRLAISLAKKALGRTHPNPAVGAVVARGGKVLGRGFHARAGAAHAEVVALAQAGAKAKGATLYTTLEPCDHHGRTPPCTAAILNAGIARVVYASSDPNPLVNGRGLKRLTKAGVAVTAKVLEDEADAMNRPFLTAMREGRAFVTLKLAAALDGKIAARSGDSKWITGDAARARVHQLRNQVDAILVGAGTALRDDPSLTTRLAGKKPGRNPVRVVLDADLDVPPSVRVYDTFNNGRAIAVCAASADVRRRAALSGRGVEVWVLPARRGKVNPRALLERLAKEGLLHLMVEGGSQVAGSFLSAGLVDELWLFIAPKLIGSDAVGWSPGLGLDRISDALQWEVQSLEKVGGDVLLIATPAR
jgi:diaminohydroxyphosphoribosylaminopyrimidine deaminase / 5-amino-6-(5-phosphoribosylamino)uracil reductase